MNPKRFLVRDIRKINSITCNAARGFYTDEHWQGKRDVDEALTRLCQENGWIWVTTFSKYDHDPAGNPCRKTWGYKIVSYDERREVFGVAVASGCGSVTSPLSRYDMVAYVC